MLTSPAVIGAAVAAWAFLRDLPAAIYGLDEGLYWHVVPVINPVEYLAFPQNGAIQAFARLTFLVAHPFGPEWGPVVLRLLSSAVIGAFAAFLVSGRMAEAIPSRSVRIGLALAIVILPVRAPFIQTLNSQWWIALMLLGVALTKPRRWDPWLVGAAGLTGLAPCAVLPAFRDRRALPLMAATAVQGTVYLMTGTGSVPVPQLSNEWLLLAASLGVLLVAPLPQRTKVGFAFLGLAWLLLGSTRGATHGADRYLLAAWLGMYLGAIAIAVAVASRATRRLTRRTLR